MTHFVDGSKCSSLILCKANDTSNGIRFPDSLNEIIEAGKRHGATMEDLYGCFYFFISEQLSMFTRRIRRFNISFTMTKLEACKLGDMIGQDLLEPFDIWASTKFDRVSVSNILDMNYVCVREVLKNWAPRPADSRWAAITGISIIGVRRKRRGEHLGPDSTYVQCW